MNVQMTKKQSSLRAEMKKVLIIGREDKTVTTFP